MHSLSATEVAAFSVAFFLLPQTARKPGVMLVAYTTKIKNGAPFIMPDLPITVGFGGGAELLFGNKKSYSVSLPGKDKEWLLGDVIFWIKDNLLKERPELFIQDDSVRPGILVLVNDADWELMDTVRYPIQPNDTILFISTLHGG